MDFCPHYNVCAWRDESDSRMLFMRLRCGKWSCDFCCQANRQMWSSFLNGQLPLVSDDWWLMTLTAHSQTRTAKTSLENIRTKIDPLIKRMKRVFGKVEYVRVFEKHRKTEAIHAHFVVSGLCPFVVYGASTKHNPGAIGVIERPYRDGCVSAGTWLKNTAHELGMGYMADVRRIDSVGRGVRYVCKYLTKSMQDINHKGLRHVQTTRRIGSPSQESEYIWQVGYNLRAEHVQPGQTVVDLQTGEVCQPDYWNAFRSYPPDTADQR